MRDNDRRLLVISLLIADGLAIAFALYLAYYVRIGSGWLPYQVSREFSPYGRRILIAVPIWLSLFAFCHLYDADYLLGGPQEYANVVTGCTFGVVALMLLGFWEKDLFLSRAWFALSWLFSVITVGGVRFGLRRVGYRLRRRGLFVRRTIILGANEHGRAIAVQLGLAASSGVDVVGFVDDFLPVGTQVINELQVLGRPRDLAQLTKELRVSEVIVVPNALAWETFREIIRLASTTDGFEIKLSPGYYEMLTTGVRVEYRNFVPLISIERARITGIDAWLKSLLDYGLALLALVVLAPFMALIAVGIKLTSTGPILERHQVLGCQNERFHTLKFRTGLTGNPRPIFANPLSFPRELAACYPLGRWLFRTGLDKLPQLFNVLKGEMSLVGPRTISVGSTDACEQWLLNLLTMKPGITGPWVVAGQKRSLEEEMRLDMYYIRNWTIWADLHILFQTLKRLVRQGRGQAESTSRSE